MPKLSHDPAPWPHSHLFNESDPAAERGTRVVFWITLAMMVLEIAAGYVFNSMALLADGWHMSSHALAIGLATLAYRAARRYAADRRFAFGTWKIEVLGGYTSALGLLAVAATMVWSSLERLWAAQAVRYDEALLVAMLGLVVNLFCAFILGRVHHGAHAHAHAHAHEHGHDLNLKSAYAHVLADALTSVLAIAALLGGLLWGWSWLDPAVGLLGGVLVGWWARGLLIETGKVLLDREMDHPLVETIRLAIETAPELTATQIVDLHVWRVGKRAHACVLVLLTERSDLTAMAVRRSLAQRVDIAHLTVEIHRPG